MSFVLEFSSFFYFIYFLKNGICSITLSEIFASCAKKKEQSFPKKKEKKKKKFVVLKMSL